MATLPILSLRLLRLKKRLRGIQSFQDVLILFDDKLGSLIPIQKLILPKFHHSALD